MSNPKNPPPKKAAQSKTSSTAPKKAAEKSPDPEVASDFDPKVAMSALQKAMELLDRKDKALAPVEKFHEAVEGAEEEDVRIYWDVHIVHGKDKSLKRVQGSSTLPSLLTDKLLPNAPSMIQQEIVEKVAVPLTGLFMKEGEKVHNPIALLDPPEEHQDASIDPERAAGGDEVMNLADEHDDEAAEIDEDEDVKARVPAESTSKEGRDD